MIQLDDTTRELLLTVKLVEDKADYIFTSCFPGHPSYDLVLAEIVEDKICGHTGKRCWVAWGGDAEDKARVGLNQGPRWRAGALMGRPVQFEVTGINSMSFVAGIIR